MGPPRQSFALRLWIYQGERFPIFKHGLLIAAFGASATSVSALLRGETPSLHATLTAIAVLFIFFFQLRVADEHKDHADDSRYRPERPVPRGLISLKELRALAFAGTLVQAVLAFALEPLLIVLLAAAWAWFGLMSAEFFAPEWLKARPILYLVSHMLIMPLLDLFATACDWLPREADGVHVVSLGLGVFLALSFVNGVVVEFGRKCWAPTDERDGVETYSKLWGPARTAFALSAVALIGFGMTVWVNRESGAPLWIMALPLLATLALLVSARTYVSAKSSKSAARLELLSGLYVLANYLALGLIPVGVALWMT